MSSVNIPGAGSGSWKPPVDTAGSLPLTNNKIGDARAAKDTGVIYVWTGTNWDTAVAGVGTVTSVALADITNFTSVSGSPITGAGTLTQTLQNQTANTVLAGPSSGPSSTPTFRALTTDDLPTNTANTIAGFDNSGVLDSINGFNLNTSSGGMNIDLIQNPNGAGGEQIHTIQSQLDPLQNSPAASYNALSLNNSIDPNSTGFTIGTSGQCLNILSLNTNHQGTSNVGSLGNIIISPSIGNGTDPIDVNGVSYSLGFGNIANNVNLTGPIQGYIFQPSLDVGTTFDTNGYVTGFADQANMPVEITGGYTSVNLTPIIGSIPNNHNYTGININQDITDLLGNANCNSIGISGNVDNVTTGGVNSVNISTNVGNMPSGTYYNGIVLGGTITTSDGNVTSINVSPNVTGGTGSYIGLNLYGTNVASSGSTTAINISGTFDKSIQVINNDEASMAIDSTGRSGLQTPISVASSLGQQYGHVIGGSVNLGSNQTLTGTDVIANNLAFSLDIGSGTTSYTKSLFGIATTGFVGAITGSASGGVDDVQMLLAGYASAHSAGNITNMYNINCLAIPTGAGGTITNAIGFHFDQPFGPVGTNNWGIMVDAAGAHNHFAGQLSVGTSSKMTANSSVGIELDSTTKAVLLSRMTTTQRDALTALGGMLIYNTTTNKLQGYENGAWVDLV